MSTRLPPLTLHLLSQADADARAYKLIICSHWTYRDPSLQVCSTDDFVVVMPSSESPVETKRVAQGSGKTLAFGLPILQLLHGEAPAAGAGALSAGSKQTEADPEVAEGQNTSTKPGHTPLRALILEPTRELAMQVVPPPHPTPWHLALPCISLPRSTPTSYPRAPQQCGQSARSQ